MAKGTLTINGERFDVEVTRTGHDAVEIHSADNQAWMFTLSAIETATQREPGPNAVPRVELDIPGEWDGEHTALVAACSLAGWPLSEESL